MSMLAEPRRKQKWTLNPRGKQWCEDSNKFGQKMLEKMGWTSGKGLGANEQGITEHVRVSVKEDTAGIGFKKDHLDKAWTEHQDGFNDFLQELQRSQSHVVIQKEEIRSELSGKSLELKSKFSRARVHYQKFTRGKDVNKYSSKDLANIFGQKELNISDNIKEDESNYQENSEPSSVGSQENRGGVITINGGNMTDYFMKKYQNFSAMPKNKKQEDTNSESEPEYTGFGFVSTINKEQSHSNKEMKGTKDTCEYAFENPCLTLNSPENICNSSSKIKSSKKRKISEYNESSYNSKKCKHGDINKSMYENGFINVALDLEGPPNEVFSRKEFEVSRTELGITNSALDLDDEINDKKRVTFNDYVEYNTDSIKKKKERATLDKFEVENKKIKKKKKHEDNLHSNVSSCFINEALNIEEMSEELHDNEINELKSKSSKKRKENRRSVLETIVEIPEEDKETGESGIKIKKNKQKENILDNSIPEENPSSKKARKKKKKIEKIEEIVATCKNNTEKSTKEVDTDIKTTFEKGDELYNQEDQETSYKLEKKKKKNIELSVEKRGEVISRIETEVNNPNNVEKAEVETIKSKKKKKMKADVDINEFSTEIVNTKFEKEISDKENANVVCELTPKVRKPKKKKHKESMDESIPDNDNSIHDMESLKEESVNQVTNASANTPNTTKNETFNSWSEKAKMSKRHLFRSLFHRNSVAHFPGSNVHEIKGYGVDIQ
ncbi:CRISPR-associated endoribonuclease Cas13a [Hylaeus anthracinus]|uniref:CRISPR-associated endoribonuclease Cas13a n=1 Tax=Hylaeus anthracinus TaxID=313031 RepID=UPI0023BA3900|nr:CRISPR-associated endoribonuclease Cas13a [Hylaeus anthracinus]